MPTIIETREQLVRNLEHFEFYLTEGTDEEVEYLQNILKRGKCYVAYRINNEVRFATSRFIGYVDMTPAIHAGTGDRELHGTRTNHAIDRALQQGHEVDLALDNQLADYCARLGISLDNNTHRFWTIDVDREFYDNGITDFVEGGIVERLHKRRERSSALVTLAKERFIEQNGRLFCEICGFDFEQRYLRGGNGFIEAHHTKPVSLMPPGYRTQVEELIMICANCHRIAHRVRPWPSVEELRAWYVPLVHEQVQSKDM